MYLPGHFPLCEPHVITWAGESGRRYDFAVARPGMPWLDEPAIYILAKREGSTTKALFVGHTESLHKHFGGSTIRCPDEWQRALVLGMTHVHVRFEPCSERSREAEVRDLMAALRPVISRANGAGQPGDAKVAGQPVAAGENDRPVAVGAAGSAPVQGTHRRSLIATLVRPAAERPAVGEERPLHVAATGRPFRADPAREDEGDLFSPVLVGSPADAFARLMPAGAASLRLDAASEQRDEEPRAEPSAAEGPQTPLSATPSAGEPAASVDRQQPAPATVTAEARLAEPAAPPAALPAAATAPAAAPTTPRRGLLARLLGALWPKRQASSDLSSEVPSCPPMANAVRTAEAGVSPALPEAAMLAANDTALPELSSPSDFPEVQPVAEEWPVDHAPSPIEPAAGDALGMLMQPTGTPVASSAEPAVAGSPEPDVASDIRPQAQPDVVAIEEHKRRLGLDATAPVVLFAAPLEYQTGADILMEAIPTVCSSHPQAQFVFAGGGSLRGDLEERAFRADLGRRCRFIGDVAQARFDQVLAACDFVVIPARERQDDWLARRALDAGKPVLTTHAAQLGLIVHGRNGLVAYDVPNSLVWGLRELLGPLYGDMRRRLAEAA